MKVTMASIYDEFPSKFLKSSDLKGEVARVKIKEVVREQIGNDNKLVMYFAGKEKGMVLNKTNALTIADAYSPDYEQWTGAEIEVFTMKVEMQGRMVDGLRIRVPRQKPAQAPAKTYADVAKAQAARDMGDNPPADGFDDSIPF